MMCVRIDAEKKRRTPRTTRVLATGAIGNFYCDTMCSGNGESDRCLAASQVCACFTSCGFVPIRLVITNNGVWVTSLLDQLLYRFLSFSSFSSGNHRPLFFIDRIERKL